MKRIAKLCYISFIIALSALLLLPALAAEIDTDKDCTLTFESEYDGRPLEGVRYHLYYVAEVSGSSAAMTPVNEFSTYPVSFDCKSTADWEALAQTLVGYVQKDKVSAAYNAVSGDSGEATISGAKCGLYLVIADQMKKDNNQYSSQPFLIFLPDKDPQSDDWNYTVTAKPKFSCVSIPEKTITKKVVKVWDDKGSESSRPEEITVILYRDGKKYSEVKLNSANRWVYEWTGLPADGDYSVVEKVPSGYQVKIEVLGNAFRITNSKHVLPTPPTPSKVTPKPSGKLPQTGQMWWPVAALGISGLVFVLLGVTMKKGKRDE